jgi:hypothetical protein
MNSTLQGKGDGFLFGRRKLMACRNSVQEIVDEYNICDEAIHLPK